MYTCSGLALLLEIRFVSLHKSLIVHSHFGKPQKKEISSYG
jgi:hypothetical protein